MSEEQETEAGDGDKYSLHPQWESDREYSSGFFFLPKGRFAN